MTNGKVYGVVTVFKSGDSIVVTIPLRASIELGIEVGDNLLVSIEDKGLTYSKRDVKQ